VAQQIVPSPQTNPPPPTQPNVPPPQLKPSATPSKPLSPPVSVPPPSNPLPPSPAEAGGRDEKKLKAEEEVNRRRKEKKPPIKSSQTRLPDVEQDPSALSILQEVNQGGDPTTTQTTDVAAPGAAIFVLDGNLINLSAKCVTALKQPMNFISRSHRTDIARIVFHIWVCSTN
jgi:hypothetical protein